MKTTYLILTVLAAAGGLISAQEAEGNPKQAYEQLMDRARDAKSAGRHEEARELAGKAEKLLHEMNERRVNKTDGGEKHAKKAPMKDAAPGPERLEHLKQAVQHLHAAGMHDVADKLQKMGENMRQSMHEQPKHDHDAKPQKKPMQEMKPGMTHPQIEELRQQMRRMQEQIEKLGAELKKQQASI
jgi:hypothetical protein